MGGRPANSVDQKHQNLPTDDSDDPEPPNTWSLATLHQELCIKLEHVKVICDGESALQLIKHQVYHERIKHIDVRLHFIRDIVSREVIKMKNVSTEDNPVDMLTKALPTAKFKHYLDLVNVKTWWALKGHLKTASD